MIAGDVAGLSFAAMDGKSSLKALIFDVDGTLADTERDGHRVAFNLAFEQAGLKWHWDVELYGELLAVTGGKERMAHYARLHDPAFLARPERDTLIRKLHTLKTQHYVHLVQAGRLPLRPGVAALIRDARAAGIRLAIATTTSPENVTALLRSTLGPEAEGWFAAIGAGDIVPAKKPAPDIYLWVLERLGLPAAACLAIEDSAHGLAAARSAGIPAIVTENRYTRGQNFGGALAVLPSLEKTGLADIANIFGKASSTG